MFEVLDDSNFNLYAARNYDNLNCMDESEFQEDLSRFKYLKRLFKKYKRDGELKERLILNHLTILFNVFPHYACTRMLCFKLSEHLEILKTFLVFLNYWPDKIEPIGNIGEIDGVSIGMNREIIDILRKI